MTVTFFKVFGDSVRGNAALDVNVSNAMAGEQEAGPLDKGFCGEELLNFHD